MKKMVKKITSIVLIAALTASVSVISEQKIAEPLTAYAAEKEYVKAIKISYADTKEKAAKEIGDEYTILDKDFNDGMKSHAWIGYSTTSDPDLAITDIKVMNMNGGFNYSDYEALLNEQKAAIKEQVDTVVPALVEYAKNYDVGMDTAKGIYEMLNVFYEDDSEKNLGDFLLEAGRKLVKNSSDSEAREDVEKVFLQGNDTVVTDIENLLVLAQDTKVVKKGSWLSRLSDLGPDGLVAIYKTAKPKLSNEKIKAQIKSDYGDDAKAILNEIASVQETFKDYEETSLATAIENGNETAIEKQMAEAIDVSDSVTEDETFSDEEDAIESYVEHTSEAADVVEAGETLVTAGIVESLKAASYGSISAYEFFMREDLTAEDLYPVAYVMSNGQKSIMQDTGLYGVFESVLAEDCEEADATWDTSLGEGVQSIYEGVDRSIFESDTAITGEALKRLSSKGDSIVSDVVFFGVSATGLLVCGMAGMRIVKYSKALSKLTQEGVLLENSTIEKSLSEYAENLTKETKALYQSNQAYQLSVMQSEGMLRGKNITFHIKNFAKLSETEQRAIWLNAKKGLTDYEKMLLWTKNDSRVKSTYIKLWVKNDTEGKIASKRTQLSELREAKISTNRTAQATARKAILGARVVFAVAAVVSIASAVYEIYNLCSEDNTEFTNIPFNMVDRTYPSGSEAITYVYYTLVTTKDDSKADLHNKKGKEWIGIYTTTASSAGDPILAESLMVSEEDTTANANYEPVTLFGEAGAYNLCNKDITGKSIDSTYIFYTKDADSVVDNEELEEADETTEGDVSDVSATGSTFADGGLIWIVLIIVAIAAIVSGITAYRRKNRG
ncbi:hypothetical protein SAMN02910417_00548 [Eubacterium oxidoreducens]|uniref:Uncharacterized protein n=2 Tax=Eubacterium oxidoreducens TaxID=1732 RepID=A0A1G6AG32_EUBOX|nr:hypothetical protein SAMN02910417_00548 [Eubacterium oxidoreducens]